MSLGIDEQSRNARKLCMSVRRIVLLCACRLMRCLLCITCTFCTLLSLSLTHTQVEQLMSKAAGMTGSKEALEVLEDCKGKLDTIQGLLVRAVYVCACV